MMSELINTEH